MNSGVLILTPLIAEFLSPSLDSKSLKDFANIAASFAVSSVTMSW